METCFFICRGGLYSFNAEQRAADKHTCIKIKTPAPVVYDSSSQTSYNIVEAEYALDDLLPLMGCWYVDSNFLQITQFVKTLLWAKK